MVNLVIVKGGEGSGHFHHAGRPGEVGGSAPSKRVVLSKPTGSMIMEAELPDFIDNYAAMDYEVAYMVSPNGEEWFLEGDESSVDIDLNLDEIAELRGGEMVHNHPSGSPFSVPDVAFAAKINLKAIHVVGVNPNRESDDSPIEFIKYTIERNGDKWGFEWDRIDLITMNTIMDLRLEGVTGSHTNTYIEYDEVWKRVSKEYDFTYTKEIIQ